MVSSFKMEKSILVTGAAGFIGANLTMRLISSGKFNEVIGIDNLNDYYDVSLKEYRLMQIAETPEKFPNVTWTFKRGDLADKDFIDKIFVEHAPEVVVNLAAQAGVRYSITNPSVYIESNIIGFFNILEACRHSKNCLRQFQFRLWRE